MNKFLNEKNSSKQTLPASAWVHYTEDKSLPTFCVDFPEKEVTTSKIDVLGKTGKHYECNNTITNGEKPPLFVKYEVYFVPLPRILIPLNGRKLVLFTERYLDSLTPKKSGGRIELGDLIIQNEKVSYLDFATLSNFPATPLLFAGRTFVVEEKYLYFLLARPQNLFSEPVFNKFLDSFKILKTS